MDMRKDPKHTKIVIHQDGKTKILYTTGSIERAKEILDSTAIKDERPMMLNAWSQTTGDDFSLLQEGMTPPKRDIYEQESNRLLLEKIRTLENTLRQQSDLLSQIHATSSRRDLCRRTSSGDSEEPSHSSFNNETSGPPLEHEDSHILTPPNSVINATKTVPIQSVERINYKIIAEASNNDEPIEIQLASDDQSNLNSSADSDRLHICFDDEPSQEVVQQEVVQIVQDNRHTPQHLIKRRKMDKNSDNEQVEFINQSPMIQQACYEIKQLNYKLPTIPKSEKTDDVTKSGISPGVVNPKRNILRTPKNRNNVQTNKNSRSAVKYDSDVKISLGPNSTMVPANLFEALDWNSPSLATRKLLVSVFDRDILATHSMTGKPSPAFKDVPKPPKKKLDPLKIQDIIFAVTRKSDATEKEVRNAITTKCADENKMMRMRWKNKAKGERLNDKENSM